MHEIHHIAALGSGSPSDIWAEFRSSLVATSRDERNHDVPDQKRGCNPQTSHPDTSLPQACDGFDMLGLRNRSSHDPSLSWVVHFKDGSYLYTSCSNSA